MKNRDKIEDKQAGCVVKLVLVGVLFGVLYGLWSWLSGINELMPYFVLACILGIIIGWFYSRGC